MIYSPEKNATLILTLSTLHLITLQKDFLKMLTLCTLGPLHHAWLVLPSTSCSLLPPSLLGVDCLSPSLLGGPSPPSPHSPELTPFPSGHRQHPTLMLGTVRCFVGIGKINKNITLGDFNYTWSKFRGTNKSPAVWIPVNICYPGTTKSISLHYCFVNTKPTGVWVDVGPPGSTQFLPRLLTNRETSVVHAYMYSYVSRPMVERCVMGATVSRLGPEWHQHWSTFKELESGSN
jgi:hypothetical protein